MKKLFLKVWFILWAIITFPIVVAIHVGFSVRDGYVNFKDGMKSEFGSLKDMWEYLSEEGT
jgi:hypothetical protein